MESHQDGHQMVLSSNTMRNKIYIDNKLLLLDNLQLSPREYDVTETGILEGYINFGTMVVINENMNETYVEKARNIIDALNLASLLPKR